CAGRVLDRLAAGLARFMARIVGRRAILSRNPRHRTSPHTPPRPIRMSTARGARASMFSVPAARSDRGCAAARSSCRRVALALTLGVWSALATSADAGHAGAQTFVALEYEVAPD